MAGTSASSLGPGWIVLFRIGRIGKGSCINYIGNRFSGHENCRERQEDLEISRQIGDTEVSAKSLEETPMSKPY